MGFHDKMLDGSAPATFSARRSRRYKQFKTPFQRNEECHRSLKSNRSSKSDESYVLNISPMSIVLLIALSLTVLATGASSGALPAKELTGQKEFHVEEVHEVLKDLFKKQKAELWGNLFDERSSGLGGGRERGRHRRSVPEDKKLLTMDEEDRLGTFVGEVSA